MGFGWKDIIPSDPYSIQFARPISATELTYVTLFYQPLIGPVSVSLYTTLYHEKSIDEIAIGNHRTLMSVMNTSLVKIIEARELLEAVGLLRTIKLRTNSEEKCFEYQLLPPMQPSSFFADDMMSIMLLNRIGKTKYHHLRKKLVGINRLVDGEEVREEITKSFDEIFHSISPAELAVSAGSETEAFLDEMESQFPVKAQVSKIINRSRPLRLEKTEIDFVFLEASLPKSLGDNRQLSSEIRELLKEIAFFYQLNDMQLSYFLQEPYIYDERNEIDADRLRLVVKEWYMHQHGGMAPKVEMAATLEQTGSDMQKVPEMTLEEEHKLALVRFSPISLLEHYQGGGKASPADVKIIDELSAQYRLKPEVINVLLEYVMMTNNKQLPKALIFKIATHWKRLGIQSVDGALEQAKQLFNEMRVKKSPTKVPAYKDPGKKSWEAKKNDLPEWVVRQLTDASRKSVVPEELDAEKKKEAMELLRALGEIE